MYYFYGKISCSLKFGILWGKPNTRILKTMAGTGESTERVSLYNTISNYITGRSRSDPPENCHLNVKKMPKTWHLKKKSSFGQFFDIQMAIIRMVRPWLYICYNDQVLKEKISAFTTTEWSSIWNTILFVRGNHDTTTRGDEKNLETKKKHYENLPNV